MIGLVFLVVFFYLYIQFLCWIARRINIPCPGMIVCFIPVIGQFIWFVFLICAITGTKIVKGNNN